MLTNAFYSVVNEDVVTWWLPSVLPQGRPLECVIEDGELVWRWHKHKPVYWSSGRIAVLLERPPVYSVPLLWELCRLYDLEDETSTLLRRTLHIDEPVPFYRYGKWLVTVYGSQKWPRKLPKVIAKKSKAGVIVRLRASTWLQKVLARRLKEVAL